MFAHSTLISPSQSLQEVLRVSCHSWYRRRHLPLCRRLGWINKPLMMPPWITGMLTAALLKCRGFLPELQSVMHTSVPSINSDSCYQIEGPHYWLNLLPSCSPIRAERWGPATCCKGQQYGWWKMNQVELKRRKGENKRQFWLHFL